jgi:hypothetical protein
MSPQEQGRKGDESQDLLHANLQPVIFDNSSNRLGYQFKLYKEIRTSEHLVGLLNESAELDYQGKNYLFTSIVIDQENNYQTYFGSGPSHPVMEEGLRTQGLAPYTPSELRRSHFIYIKSREEKSYTTPVVAAQAFFDHSQQLSYVTFNSIRQHEKIPMPYKSILPKITTRSDVLGQELVLGKTIGEVIPPLMNALVHGLSDRIPQKDRISLVWYSGDGKSQCYGGYHSKQKIFTFPR